MQSSGPQAPHTAPVTSLVPAGSTAFPAEIGSIGDFRANRVDLDSSVKVHHLPTWKHKGDPVRIKALREIALTAGRDPRMATLAVSIVRGDASAWGSPIPGAKPRDTRGQSALLLRWVQGLYYVNEPGERLQDPLYTVQVGYGDCDDLAMLLAALAESLRIPWRYVLSGRNDRGKTIRWVEGERIPRAKWAHIYVALGDRPFTPKRWAFAEPTIRGVPLGWDVVQATTASGKVILPELAGPDVGGGPDDRAPLMVKRASGDKPFVQHVIGEVQGKLHPRTLVPLLVTGIIIGALSERVRKLFK
jgi:transglutaminase-like putative cysteine protease